MLASKVAGPFVGSVRPTYIRNGHNRLDKKHIEWALDDTLKRLQTDYLDVYQVHWPDRHVNLFGGRGLAEINDHGGAPIEETRHPGA